MLVKDLLKVVDNEKVGFLQLVNQEEKDLKGIDLSLYSEEEINEFLKEFLNNEVLSTELKGNKLFASIEIEFKYAVAVNYFGDTYYVYAKYNEHYDYLKLMGKAYYFAYNLKEYGLVEAKQELLRTHRYDLKEYNIGIPTIKVVDTIEINE